VHKDVRAIFAADETITLGIVEPLYCTFQAFHLRPLGHEPFLLRGRAFRFSAIFRLLEQAVKGNESEKT